MFDRAAAAALTVAGALAAGLALVGCSGNSPPATPSVSSSAAAAPTSAMPAPTFTGANADFCNAAQAAITTGNGFQAAQAAGDTAALKAEFKDLMVALKQLRTSLPADAPDELHLGLTQVIRDAQARASGKAPSSSPDPSESAALQNFGASFDAYTVGVCPGIQP
jgi:hypothetical protein